MATCSCGHLLVLSCHAHEAAHAKAGSELDCLGVPRHSSSASTFLVHRIHLSHHCPAWLCVCMCVRGQGYAFTVVNKLENDKGQGETHTG